MVATVSISPMLVGSASNSFFATSEGYIQGVALDDPSARNTLSGGVALSTLTTPIWGGTGITESLGYPPVQTSNPQDNLGQLIGVAATTAAVQGFAVYNQAHNMVTTTQSTAPVSLANMGVNYHRLGSGARIVVKADPTLASLEGGTVKPATGYSWDCTAQVLQPYQASASTLSITGITVNATTGVATVTLSGALSGWTFTAGDTVVISGATNTGTAPVALLNQDQKIVSITSSTVFTIQLPTNQGTWGTIGGTILLNYSGGALAVTILGLNIGNSMVVDWDPVNNLAVWDRAGTTAVILI
jgi:hypothetical protein